MKNAKTSRLNAREKSGDTLNEEARREEYVLSLIKGLDQCLVLANTAELGTAARILYNAKEEIVLWAVNMGYHETAEERFINRHLYNGNIFNNREFLNFISKTLNKAQSD